MNKQPLVIITGKIVHGRGRGKEVGMPTANLKMDRQINLPGFGVYASSICVENKWYMGVTNIGLRPSVDDDKDITIETFILDFDYEIYDLSVELKIFKYIRDTIKMDSLRKVQL